VTQDDITQPTPRNTQQDDATLYVPPDQQSDPYAQEPTAPPPPAPYYTQPATPVQSTGPAGPEATPTQDNAYYPQAPATLTQTPGNTNYAAATPPTPPTPPQSPPQKSKWSRKKIFLLGGAIILVLFLLGMAGAWLIPTLQAQGNNQASSTSTASASPVARPRQVSIYARYLTRYGPTIRNQIAQDLHLAPVQLANKLRSGQTLSAIATAQGVSATQLQTIVTNAFQNGLQPAVTSGSLTQQQVNVLVRRMLRQPQALTRFLEMLPRAKATPVNNQ
jgi:hypothetical protein